MSDRSDEARTLYTMAKVSSNLGQLQKALEFFNQGLPILARDWQPPGRGRNSARHRRRIQRTWGKAAGIGLLQPGTSIFRQLKNPGGEGSTLVAIGLVYMDLGDKQKALDFYNQALPIFHQAGDHGGEAQTLTNIGAADAALGELQKALDFYNQALPIFHQVGNR